MFGLFIIEAGKEPVPLLNIQGKPVVAENGVDAAIIADRCKQGLFWDNGYVIVKVQPRRLSDDAWKARELARFADGTYVPLPWSSDPWFKLSLTADHYAHVSTEDGAKVAYTKDACKGAGDIQTRVKPGKYLQQFYSDVLDAPTIARLAAEFSATYGEQNELLFATTPDEIEAVYREGPQSCMSGDKTFQSDIHPCRIYGAGDLAVAYMERDDRVTARALVWPDKKLHSRIYGDESRMSDLLDAAGYVSGSFDGARMLRIEERFGVFVVPYIDGYSSCKDDGEHLILAGRGGDVCCSNTNGLSGSLYSCEECGEGVDDDGCHSDEDGYTYCEHCYNEIFGYCEYTEEGCRREGMHEVRIQTYSGRRIITQMWSEYAYDNHAFTCEGNGQDYHRDMRVELADGTEWSQEYFEDHGSICDGSGECYASADMVQLEDGTCWSKDYFADNGVEVGGKFYAKGDEPSDETEAQADEVAA